MRAQSLVRLLQGLYSYTDPQYPPVSFALTMVTLPYKGVSEQHQHMIWLNCENPLQVKSYLVLNLKAHTSLTLQAIYFYTFFDFKHAVYDL